MWQIDFAFAIFNFVELFQKSQTDELSQAVVTRKRYFTCPFRNWVDIFRGILLPWNCICRGPGSSESKS